MTSFKKLEVLHTSYTIVNDHDKLILIFGLFKIKNCLQFTLLWLIPHFSLCLLKNTFTRSTPLGSSHCFKTTMMVQGHGWGAGNLLIQNFLDHTFDKWGQYAVQVITQKIWYLYVLHFAQITTYFFCLISVWWMFNWKMPSAMLSFPLTDVQVSWENLVFFVNKWVIPVRVKNHFTCGKRSYAITNLFWLWFKSWRLINSWSKLSQCTHLFASSGSFAFLNNSAKAKPFKFRCKS